eukprot:scaffold15022_cov117-Isochrysis_galbana.AAC.1
MLPISLVGHLCEAEHLPCRGGNVAHQPAHPLHRARALARLAVAHLVGIRRRIYPREQRVLEGVAVGQPVRTLEG